MRGNVLAVVSVLTVGNIFTGVVGERIYILTISSHGFLEGEPWFQYVMNVTVIKLIKD
jgi:hypothetical protein